MASRFEVEQNLGLPQYYRLDGDDLLVNGHHGLYKLWVDANDKSITPCLTGEVGGIPGMWESWITTWHLNNFKDFDTYIDIGANSGYFTFLAAEQGLDVLAFEANPRYYDLLAKSRKENNLKGTVNILPCAITDGSSEKVILHVPTTLHGGASILGKTTIEDTTPVEVDWLTLDDLVTPQGNVLIKLDVEGAEEQVFRGARRFNEAAQPTYVLEYTPRAYSDAFFDDLTAYGQVTVLDFNGNEQAVTKASANASQDWITLVVRPHTEEWKPLD